MKLLHISMLVALLGTTGCDQINNALNRKQREAKAVGAGCRLSGRSLEDCYKRNPRADRAEVYSGWREMHDYMMQKKIDNIAPPADEPKPDPKTEAAEEDQGKDKPAAKEGDKSAEAEKGKTTESKH
ncbi:hypothetical protein HNQ59_003296 [Chitinivorax tropicus]|uniref:Lipoprotein n=1 Tax=Chitinivorax tropicus TaxID=714531 RepID=A0A840MMX3_9PROT|nr:hypothetical protein [Chitinivorax tropicus]MBB5019988.1 hypothetical protein [Chitinivorax tropicus]